MVQEEGGRTSCSRFVELERWSLVVFRVERLDTACTHMRSDASRAYGGLPIPPGVHSHLQRTYVSVFGRLEVQVRGWNPLCGSAVRTGAFDATAPAWIAALALGARARFGGEGPGCVCKYEYECTEVAQLRPSSLHRLEAGPEARGLAAPIPSEKA